MDLARTKIFNNAKVLIEGWYWALRSSELKKEQAKPFRLMNKDLVIWRGKDGKVRAFDAFCPHMGAHLGEGRVKGNQLHCLFHDWRFGEDGTLQGIPCEKHPPRIKPIRSWPVAERYGLIWVYTGETPRSEVPFVPELEGEEVAYRLGNRFFKECHPAVMMINAIDEQHFASVHPMAGGLATNLRFAVHSNNDYNIHFQNSTPVPTHHWLTRLLGRFYATRMTYDMCYWFASTGTVTLGPDFLHFHIIFATRPTPDGKTEGQTILVTRRRKGLLGRLLTRPLLFVTDMVGRYFAHGDTKIFRSIRFELKCPLKADHSIVQFIAHTERQTLARWTDEAQEEAPTRIRGATRGLEPPTRREGEVLP